MRTSGFSLRRLFVILIISASAFCAGYIAPHTLPAQAQPGPHPTSGVPIGVGGHGLVQIWQAQTDPALGGQGWPCPSGKPCTVDIDLRTTATSSAVPTPFDCTSDASQKNCLTFSSTDYEITLDDNGTQTVNVAGMIQIFK